MTFISYAQNSEDVLLWRALQHVGKGFYIDIGANDPEEHSVTKAFYDAGWHGINVEPMPSYHQVFLRERPRDINLAVACGAEEGSITLFDTPSVNGWASTDRDTAIAHRAEGIAVVETEVPLRTLRSICEEHVRGDIHFLKIDVEGFEGEVLKGMDFQRWRPWVLVIEATLPNSRVTAHERWEGLVTPHDYHFAYFDGLNRYYVAGEKRELMQALAVQANVFDEFIFHHLDKAWKRGTASDAAAAEAEHRAAETSAQLAQVLQQLDAALSRADDSEQRFRTAANALREAERTNQIIQGNADAAEIARRETAEWALQLQKQLADTYASTSWRVTRPLRMLGHYGRIRERWPALRKALLKRLHKAARWLASQQAVRKAVLPLMQRFPWLGKRLMGTWTTLRDSQAMPLHQPGVPADLIHMPQSARKVLADLQRLRSTSKH